MQNSSLLATVCVYFCKHLFACLGSKFSEATLKRENTHTPAATGCLEIHKVRHIPCHLRERKTRGIERRSWRREREALQLSLTRSWLAYTTGSDLGHQAKPPTQYDETLCLRGLLPY